MKIIIASESNKLTSKIDKHLARCAYFLIYDTNTKQYEFIENEFKSIKESAGLRMVEYFKKVKIKRVVASDIGAKVKEKLDELKIQIIIIPDTNKKMKDFLKLMNNL